ncbi:hypothetical protein RCIA12 [Methanocella arvoryzae MRE50]|uniref:Uncharacterized protein n=1 Tax=Methanocella arvoryzae (strain DSM 22066 / NBRC 105507 / MRE50) TaxID=351160 RepID=Q0W7A7_METAR|nr:hypothetical protein orf19 [uncultured archaeon]CAJ35736.1 hypothetical protein RCIA12 [Methanocella arvoryzae MRE50]
MASLAPWRAWRYFRLTHGQLSIFHSLYLNVPFFIMRVLGGLAALAETTSFIGREGFLIRLCVLAPLHLCELSTRRPGAGDIQTFHRTISR